MNGKERISRILKHQQADRIGLYEHFWNDTLDDYTAKGYLKEGENLVEHFGLDIVLSGPFNTVIDFGFEPVTVSEDDRTITVRDGNGALLRRHKLHDSTPEHVAFTITGREGWEEAKHLLLENTEQRIDFEGYRNAKADASTAGRFFAWSGVNVFECMHPVCGHENMLVGMALDPEWIEDMAQTYGELIVKLQEILFEREGYPDGIWYYEDMGFKQKPFMSPNVQRPDIPCT